MSDLSTLVDTLLKNGIPYGTEDSVSNKGYVVITFDKCAVRFQDGKHLGNSGEPGYEPKAFNKIIKDIEIRASKPTLGVMPEYLFEEGRVNDLILALARQISAKQPQKYEWLDELYRRLKDRKERPSGLVLRDGKGNDITERYQSVLNN